jgi:hypothetical protein
MNGGIWSTKSQVYKVEGLQSGTRWREFVPESFRDRALRMQKALTILLNQIIRHE